MRNLNRFLTARMSPPTTLNCATTSIVNTLESLACLIELHCAKLTTSSKKPCLRNSADIITQQIHFYQFSRVRRACSARGIANGVHCFWDLIIQIRSGDCQPKKARSVMPAVVPASLVAANNGIINSTVKADFSKNSTTFHHIQQRKQQEIISTKRQMTKYIQLYNSTTDNKLDNNVS